MAKGRKSIFFCQNCGHEENKWLGQCPMCKEWNTFVEEAVTVTKASTVKQVKEAEVVTLNSVETNQEDRIRTKIEELERVHFRSLIRRLPQDEQGLAVFGRWRWSDPRRTVHFQVQVFTVVVQFIRIWRQLRPQPVVGRRLRIRNGL